MMALLREVAMHFIDNDRRAYTTDYVDVVTVRTTMRIVVYRLYDVATDRPREIAWLNVGYMVRWEVDGEPLEQPA